VIQKKLTVALEQEGEINLIGRLDVFNLMRDLQMISESQYSERIWSVLELDLSKSTTASQKDLICALQVQADVNYDQVIPERWRDPEFNGLLGCLRPKDVQIHQHWLAMMLEEPDSELGEFAIAGLTKSRITNTEVIAKLLLELISNKYWLLRLKVATILGGSPRSDLNLAESLSRVLLDSKEYFSVRFAAGEVLKGRKDISEEVQLNLVKVIVEKNEDSLRNLAAETLLRVKKLSSESKTLLFKMKSSFVENADTVRELYEKLAK
jgi:hypothetical protein